MELEKVLAWAEQELLEIQQEAEAAAKVVPEPPVPRLTIATIRTLDTLHYPVGFLYYSPSSRNKGVSMKICCGYIRAITGVN
jgi:hypothetical protein